MVSITSITVQSHDELYINKCSKGKSPWLGCDKLQQSFFHFYEFNIVSKKGRKNLRNILFSFLSFNGSVTWGPYRSKWMCQKHQYINTDEEGSNMMKFISVCKIYNCQKLKMMTNMGFRICQKYDLHEDKYGGLRRYFLPAAPL